MIVSSKRRRFLNRLNSQKYLYMLLAVPLIWFLVVCYYPMAGIVIAFKEFDLSKGIFGSPWVGLKYFRQFAESYQFATVLRNTLGISILKLIIGFPIPIIFALMLNEVRSLKYKKVVQTVSYLPYFISWVIIIGIWGTMLSVDGGIINKLFIYLGIVNEPVNFMLSSQYMWPISIITDIWKNIGWNSIIFIASLASINTELYDASGIDGAGRWKQLWHVTLPGMRPTITIMFIFAVGSIFYANFEQMYMLGKLPVLDATEVIDTYVYRVGLKQLQFSIGAAASLMRSVVAIILLFITNKLAKLVGEEGIW